MKKKHSSPAPSSNLPVSKQTAGGIAGAIVGGVIAGPVGAVAGAIAGTMMGNRAAEGKTLVSSGTLATAKSAAKAVKDRLPLRKGGRPKAAAGQPAKAKPPKAKLRSTSSKSRAKRTAASSRPARRKTGS